MTTFHTGREASGISSMIKYPPGAKCVWAKIREFRFASVE
jgi:hypothetical protein